jgi:hypothetical protein
MLSLSLTHLDLDIRDEAVALAIKMEHMTRAAFDRGH